MTTTLIAQEDSAQRGIIIIITDITSIKKAEQALKESEERFSLFMEHFPAAVLIQDLNGNFVYVNKKFCETLGRSKDVILRSNERDFLPEDTYEKFHEEDIRVIENNITIESETVYPAPAGERTWRTYKFPLYREGGRTLIGVVSLDVTKRKQAENLIRESEEKYRNIFESSPIALWEEDISELQKNLDRLRKRGITDIKKYIQENPEFLPEALAMITVTGVNNATLELYNVKDKNEFIGKLEQIITPDDIPFLADQIEALYQGAPSIEGEKHEKTFKGDEKDFYIKIAFPQDPSDHRQIVSIVDITERKQLIKSLHTALEEKELLMRELQHRTKNTITLISSIINLESRHVHDDHALSLLDSIRNRLSAIAQVYQSLYQQENIGRVDLKRYLTEIAESFIDLYKSGKQKVVFQTDMDDVQLDIKRGTSFGLIVTELLTNSLKHGISDKEARSFIIRFTLRKRENHLVFTISDNGFPLLENFSMTKTDSFGLNMISYLVQDLDGEINWSQEEGWKHFSLSIPV